MHIGCTACNADGHRQTDASMEGGYREAGGLAPHLSDALSVASAMSTTSRSGGGATTGRQMPSPLWQVQGGSASLASPRGAALIYIPSTFQRSFVHHSRHPLVSVPTPKCCKIGVSPWGPVVAHGPDCSGSPTLSRCLEHTLQCVSKRMPRLGAPCKCTLCKLESMH